MDGVRERFPSTANAILYIAVQYLLSGVGVGGSDRVRVSQQPGFNLLYCYSEKRRRFRFTGIEGVEHFLLKVQAVLAVQVHDHHHRGGKVPQALSITSEQPG